MTDVTVRRELPASQERVWRALTTAEELHGWYWPPRLAPVVETDPREGGRFRIASEVAGMAASGSYTILRSPELVAFTWQWDGEDAESTVRVELSSKAAGTELVLTHSGLAESEISNHRQGWSDCLDRLPEWLAAN